VPVKPDAVAGWSAPASVSIGASDPCRSADDDVREDIYALIIDSFCCKRLAAAFGVHSIFVGRPDMRRLLLGCEDFRGE
jgi:hypothetical protein